MRFIGAILGFVAFSVLPSARGQGVTIVQLRDFLLAQHRLKHPDNETAARLSSVTLTERLTGDALRRIITETKPGLESVEQLRLLADDSIFVPPPPSQSSIFLAPSATAQKEMVRAGAEYAQTALQHLPDFLAIRYTRRFDNTPQRSGDRHPKPKIQLHWIGEFKDQITYRNGTEMTDGSRGGQTTAATIHPGMLSMGEFGPILAVVFGDSAQGGVEWARWEMDPADGRLAVFHFVVPKSASHYLVDYCCYRNAEDEMQELSFHDHPAYHGEVALSPDSGVVRRITIQADVESSAPIAGSDLAVQYGAVEIGGRSYVCPVRSIARTDLHSIEMEHIDGVGIERHLNEVQYIDYHKFGSTSRIVTTP